MFTERRALHAKSHRSRYHGYTGVYIAAVLFLLLPHHFFAIAASFFCYCRIIFLQTAMKRSPHPAGRALRTQRKFVALAWSRVTPHPPPPLRYALLGNIYCQYGSMMFVFVSIPVSSYRWQDSGTGAGAHVLCSSH